MLYSFLPLFFQDLYIITSFWCWWDFSGHHPAFVIEYGTPPSRMSSNKRQQSYTTFLHLVTKPGIEKRTESNDRGRGQTCRLRSKFANNWCFGEESLKPEFDGVNASLSPASGIRNQIPQYWSMQYFIGVGHILSLFS